MAKQKPAPKIAAILAEMDRGNTTIELNEKLKSLIAAVLEYGKGGELTLKLRVRLTGLDEVHISPEITSKLPKAKPRETLFFVTEDQELVRDDPKQDDLPGIDREQAENVTPMPKQNIG